MSRTWLEELRRLLPAAALLAFAGWLVGYPLAVLLAGAVVYLVWHVLQLGKLRRWLEKSDAGEGDLPDAGAWAPIAHDLARLVRRNRRQKERLRKVIARFQAASEAAPDGAVVLRERGEILWLNSAAERLLGLRATHDVGHPIANLVRSPAFTSYLGKERFDEPLEMSSQADLRLRLLIRVVPYGEDLHLMMVRDITRLHRLEEMRRDFVANVSHELRSPLTVIMGYLETMSDDPQAPAEWRRPLQEMSHQARRMHRIVEDLLRLSRIEHDPGGAPRTRVHVAEMLESIRRDALGLEVEAPPIELEVDRDICLLGDYNELYSAFSNLVFNAVQYTDADGEVRLVWRREDDGASLEVRDTGVGIEAHHIARLTERFYRVDKARSRKVGGTGLGLAIVKHVLMRHDATLSVESEPGEGSVFACHFPAMRVTRAEQREAASG
ncbi:MAG: phosphate regulon sensor histidine kinase PhoR [Gammaproteobacteria bacterium]|nr:phosphate regulon sensor histidine kinase PhoR [Gammaproteobacteria bacterium]